jgi:hypothetical protein
MLFVSGSSLGYTNEEYSLDLASYDEGDDTLTWTIDWNDGYTTTVQGSLVSVVHTYIAPKAMEGDFDMDGDVGGFDVLRFKANYGKSGEGLLGDFNNDGKVDVLDLKVLSANYGKAGWGKYMITISATDEDGAYVASEKVVSIRPASELAIVMETQSVSVPLSGPGPVAVPVVEVQAPQPVVPPIQTKSEVMQAKGVTPVIAAGQQTVSNAWGISLQPATPAKGTEPAITQVKVLTPAKGPAVTAAELTRLYDISGKRFELDTMFKVRDIGFQISVFGNSHAASSVFEGISPWYTSTWQQRGNSYSSLASHGLFKAVAGDDSWFAKNSNLLLS